MLDNLNINGFPRKMNKKKRIVRKGGLTNVTYKNISKKRRRYISDLYTTLLDSSWSYVVLLFASSFYGSWILFGGKNPESLDNSRLPSSPGSLVAGRPNIPFLLLPP